VGAFGGTVRRVGRALAFRRSVMVPVLSGLPASLLSPLWLTNSREKGLWRLALDRSRSYTHAGRSACTFITNRSYMQCPLVSINLDIS